MNPAEGSARNADDASIATSIATEAPPKPKKKKWRPLLAYWILGLCNNYGYVVMLTAASDIIHKQEKDQEKIGERQCALMSTGAILLADIIPSLCVKLLAPFLPFYVRIRVIVCISLASSGFILVGVGINWIVVITGVVCTSLAAGFGEVTYLQYSNFYDKNVVSTWSSGTGGAGVFGSLSYALLQLIGLRTTLFIMLIIPTSMGLVFFLLLPAPEPVEEKVDIQTKVNEDEITHPRQALLRKLKLIPSLFKYMVPFGAVYLFEYFINQTAFELINFRNTDLNQNDQYRWLQVVYQIGVLLSRSSVNLFRIKWIWLLAVLQAINVIIYTTEVIYFYIPYYWIVVLLTLWEGLLGGAAYVNTFYKIATEVEEENKQFSMAITSFSDSIGITLAGILAIAAHNAICKLPLPDHVKKNATHI